jgi:hypothetical protein
MLRELFSENEACQSTIANLMPEIADTDGEMQESAPAFLDAVVQASKERLAKKKLVVQPAQAKTTNLKLRIDEKRGKEVGAGGGGQENSRLADGEREKDMEAAEKIAEQETFNN